MVLLTNLQMQAPYTGASTQHKDKSFRQAFIDEMQTLLDSTTFNAASTKKEMSSLYSGRMVERWYIAIILADTVRDDDIDDNIVFREIINKLPQAVQAYYNITGQKLNAVVTKSSWKKPPRRDRSSITEIVNRIGIQYPDQRIIR